MLSEQLKKDTHKAHVDVEKLILPAIKNLGTNNSYIAVLSIFYGFFKPLEEKIQEFITSDILPDINERRKSDSILRDISFLDNSNKSAMPVCDNLPKIYNLPQALGAMYVLEGSTLGGVHLTKMISEKMKITDGRGIEFFSGYGSETMKKWSVFKNTLNAFESIEGSGTEVITAANETFTKFKNWIEMN